MLAAKQGGRIPQWAPENFPKQSSNLASHRGAWRTSTFQDKRIAPKASHATSRLNLRNE